jgi:hypothetical protein
MNDYPLITVIGVALACMGAVIVVGGLVKPMIPQSIECTITVPMADRVNVTYVGKGEVY